MTAGKRIEALRKKEGLSQEELASRLYVSRQTISQWENEQTTPTVENYLRLCDVFGVTMNDFFDSAQKAQESDESRYSEKYVWKYTEDELYEISRIVEKPLRTRLIVTAVLLAVAFVLAVLSGITAVCAAVAAVSAAVFVRWAIYLKSFKSATKKQIALIADREYHYGVLENMIALTVYDSKNDIVAFDKIYQSGIDRVVNTEKYCIITYKMRNYIIKKEELCKNSLIAIIGGFSE